MQYSKDTPCNDIYCIAFRKNFTLHMTTDYNVQVQLESLLNSIYIHKLILKSLLKIEYTKLVPFEQRIISTNSNSPKPTSKIILFRFKKFNS